MLSTLQSASVTPLGSTRVVAVNVHVPPAASGAGLLQSQWLAPEGAQAAPVKVVGLVLTSITLSGSGWALPPKFKTLISNLQSQSVLPGSEAQPLAVFWMLSFGPAPPQAGLGMAWAVVAESLPAGFCTEPGLGLTMAMLLVAEQNEGPRAYLVQNGTMFGTPGGRKTGPSGVQVTALVPVQKGEVVSEL